MSTTRPSSFSIKYNFNDRPIRKIPSKRQLSPGTPEAPLPHSWESRAGQTENAAWLLIFAAATLLALLFMVGVVLNGMQSFRGENTREEEAEETIDRFMTLLKNHQEDQAYGLFSSRRPTGNQPGRSEENEQRQRLQLVQGYRRIEVKSFRLNQPAFAPLQPAPARTATVSGLVFYRQHEAGQFEATLEEEGEDWKLLEIHISPTPDFAS